MKNYLILLLLVNYNWTKASVQGGSLTPIQMAATDIKKVQNYYNTNSSMTINTYYMAFDEHTSSQIKEGKHGLFMKNNRTSYSKILDIETLTYEDIIINIDHEENMIIVGDNAPASINPFSNHLDSLLMICTDIDYVQINSAERKYLLDFSENEYSEYDKIELTIDVKNSRFNKVALFYRAAMNLSGDYNGDEKPPRLEITYKNYRSTIGSPSLLNKNNYVVEKDGKLFPSSNYKNYKIMDLRKKNRIKGYKK